MTTRRKRCALCEQLSAKWQTVSGYTHCYDGCFSTLGMDRRTVDGAPAWLPYANKPAWDPSRMSK